MALVTLEDLKNYMDIKLNSPKQEDGAQLVLDGLHGELEAVLNRPIEVDQFVETWRIPEELNPYSFPLFSYNASLATRTYVSPYDVLPTYILYLDRSPVLSVQSVSKVGPLSNASVGMSEGTDFLPVEFGLYLYSVYGGEEVTVAYTAGLEGENIRFFKLVMLRAAAREIQNLHDDTVGLKDLNTRNVAPLATGFTDSELRTLKRYKRQRI